MRQVTTDCTCVARAVSKIWFRDKCYLSTILITVRIVRATIWIDPHIDDNKIGNVWRNFTFHNGCIATNNVLVVSFSFVRLNYNWNNRLLHKCKCPHGCINDYYEFYAIYERNSRNFIKYAHYTEVELSLIRTHTYTQTTDVALHIYIKLFWFAFTLLSIKINWQRTETDEWNVLVANEPANWVIIINKKINPNCFHLFGMCNASQVLVRRKNVERDWNGGEGGGKERAYNQPEYPWKST